MTLGVLALSLVALAAFVGHCLTNRNPLVSPSLFRSREYSGATLVAALFTMAFSGMLLSIVLWEQGVWRWSAFATGLAIAPGPLMVPVFSFLVAGRMIARFGPGVVSAAGAAIFAVGTLTWALAIGVQPDYVGEALGGMILVGVGVGLAFPTYVATAATSLPPQSFATGSAVMTMMRQIGLAIGVAVLVALVGSSMTPTERLVAFHRGWIVIAALSLASAAVGLVVLPKRHGGAALPAMPSRESSVTATAEAE